MGKFARTLAIDLGASSGRGIVFEIDGKDIRQTAPLKKTADFIGICRCFLTKSSKL